MRILLATPHAYLPQLVGGAELSTHTICLQMKDRHHQVAVMAPLSKAGLFGLRSRIIRRLSRSNFSTDWGLGYPVFRGWSLESHLDEIIAKFRPDGLIVAMLGARSLPLVTAVASTGLPTLVYVRNTTGLQDCTMRFPQGVRMQFVANSGFTRTLLSTTCGIAAHVIPPIILPESYRVDTRRSHVVFINPHPVKGGDIATSIVARLPHIPFLFVESWNLPKEVKSKYKQALSTYRNVTWLSPTSDMRKIYRQAKLVMIPSQWEETWGRVATEAHVSAIPVIASQVGGLPESVGPGGVLLPLSASTEDWVNTIGALWNDDCEYRRLSECAAAYSKRSEIQPDYLIQKLIHLLTALQIAE